MIDHIDGFVYNNEEESEMGQLHAIHYNMNAVADVLRKMKKESKTHCEECGDPIPLARQKAVGCSTCVDCQEQLEHSNRMYKKFYTNDVINSNYTPTIVDNKELLLEDVIDTL